MKKPIEVTLYRGLGICSKCGKQALMVFPQAFCKRCNDDIEKKSQHPEDVKARNEKVGDEPPP